MAKTADISVLVVEDSALTAQELCESIKAIPCSLECSTVDTESDALTKCSESLPDFIVLDVRLKEGTGFNVLRALKHANPKPTILVVTNYAIPQYREYALLMGADFFLDKAVALSAIPTILESLIGTRERQRARHHQSP